MAPLFAAQPAFGKLIYTHLTEAFTAYLKVSLLVGLIFSFPILLYQCWMFVAPGLKKSEKKTVLSIVCWATLLFVAGTAFGFFQVIPKMLVYLLSFSGAMLEPLPKLGAYLTFVARTSLTFGLCFEIPFLMVMAAKVGLVQKDYFTGNRKAFYLSILVLSFLLTAGEIFGAAMLAIPLFGLYESGVFFCKVLVRKETEDTE
jgi:sec-independent protein translocase protein TatC